MHLKMMVAVAVCPSFLWLAGAAARAEAEPTDPETFAKEFLKVFSEADAKKMQTYFGDRVLVAGDLLRPVVPEKEGKATEITKGQLSDAYTKIFEKISREKWGELFKNVKPTLTRATRDGEHYELAKAGDYVYDLHWREARKGKRRGLDETVIFVIRKVEGKYRIVAHFADY